MTTVAASFTLGDLAARFTAVLAASATPVAAAFIVMTLMYVASDQFVPPESQLRVQGPLGLFSTIVTYVLTMALLRRSGAEAPRHRIGAYIGLAILSGLAILVGFALLIVPGVILISRWMIAAPLMLAEDTPVTDALSKSWHATADTWGKLIVAQLVLAAPLIAGFAVIAVGTTGEPDEIVTLPVSLASNALLSLWSAAATVLSVAAYRIMRPADSLAEVFA